MPTPLPHDAARMAWWLSAWLRGDAGPDDVLDHVVGDDAAHDVAGLDGAGGPEPVPLVLALGRLRAAGARSAGLALPSPGDPVGLGGPREFNAAALEVGEAVVLEGADLGLVPHRAGAGVVWQAHPAARRQLTDLGEADRGLRAGLSETADALAALDVARWRPEVADALMDLRHRATYDAPAGTPPRAVELAGRAVQAIGIVGLALEDHGGAVTAQEIMHREDALRPLEAAGRRALVAACSPEVWPPA
jgi:hypothetical protein